MNFRLTILILSTFVSCNPERFNTEQELTKFAANPNNGLRKNVEMNNVSITVTYRPTDLIVSQQIGDDLIDSTTLSTLRDKYGSYYYFTLSLSENNNEVLNTRKGMAVYSNLVQIMSFQMDQYVSLSTNISDSIQAVDFVLNRTFSMSSSTDLLFVFSKRETEGSEWVQFNLSEFGLELGQQRFRFLKKDLDNTPIIDFQTIRTLQPHAAQKKPS